MSPHRQVLPKGEIHTSKSFLLILKEAFFTLKNISSKWAIKTLTKY